jgi:hypothetical protein
MLKPFKNQEAEHGKRNTAERSVKNKKLPSVPICGIAQNFIN